MLGILADLSRSSRCRSELKRLIAQAYADLVPVLVRCIRFSGGPFLIDGLYGPPSWGRDLSYEISRPGGESPTVNPAHLGQVLCVILNDQYLVGQAEYAMTMLNTLVSRIDNIASHEFKSMVLPLIKILAHPDVAIEKHCEPREVFPVLAMRAASQFIGKRPAEPQNWSKNAKYDTCCPDCRSLQIFLNDPTKQVAGFSVGKQRRMHLHRILDRYDVKHQTQRSGNPQTLVVTKTRNGWSKGVAAYEEKKTEAAQLVAGLDQEGHLSRVMGEPWQQVYDRFCAEWEIEQEEKRRAATTTAIKETGFGAASTEARRTSRQNMHALLPASANMLQTNRASISDWKAGNKRNALLIDLTFD
jgi:hypothetical protein